MNGESYINLIENEKAFKSWPLFDSSNIQWLIDSVINNEESVFTELLTRYRIEKVKSINGVEKNITVGDKQMSGVYINLLHWAVYTNNLKALKLLLTN